MIRFPRPNIHIQSFNLLDRRDRGRYQSFIAEGNKVILNVKEVKSPPVIDPLGDTEGIMGEHIIIIEYRRYL